MVTPIDAGNSTFTIPVSLIYRKLGEDLVRRTLVEVITPHTLESFRKQRKEINDTIEVIAKERFNLTPLKLYTVTINKVGYPKTYVEAADKIKKEQMSIDFKTAEEEAKREKLKQEEITIAIDQRVRLAKAETIRLENKKTSEGLNPMLLEYRKMELEDKRLDVDLEFAKAAQNSGNSVIYYPTGQKPEYVETRMGQIK
tara:strand:- start:47 stop:643 length:597 start_codon:yes stop_codon:yes gene_type:complete